MDKKKIKRLCKIAEVIGYLFIGGGLFGIVMGMGAGKWKEITIKAASLVSFLGGVLLIPQDVLDKKELDEKFGYRVNHVISPSRLYAYLIFDLYIAFMIWTHY